MGVFINGENCAVVLGTNSAVSVNTINDQTNAQYFVNNTDSHLATVIRAHHSLTAPCRHPW